MSFRRRRLRDALVFALAATVSTALYSPRALAAVPQSGKSGGAKHGAAHAGSIDPELQEAIDKAPSAADWPNNNYARLLDMGNVTVKPDGTVVAKYRLTYKLFNERARDRLAEVNLPYNSSYQSIRVISARTIKKDGTVVEVAPSDIRTTAAVPDA